MNKDEKNYIKVLANQTRKSCEFISKGRVTINVGKNGLKVVGEKEDQEMVKNFFKMMSGEESKENLVKTLRYFGWKASWSGATIKGEGAIVCAMYEWISSDDYDKDFCNYILPNLRIKLDI